MTSMPQRVRSTKTAIKWDCVYRLSCFKLRGKTRSIKQRKLFAQDVPEGAEYTHKPCLESLLEFQRHFSRHRGQCSLRFSFSFFFPRRNKQISSQASARRGYVREINVINRGARWRTDFAAVKWKFETASICVTEKKAYVGEMRDNA